MGRSEGAGLQGEVLVRPEVVNPQLAGPRVLRRRLAVEEQPVPLHATGIEDACWQPQQRIHIALLQQTSADRLALGVDDLVGGLPAERRIRQHQSGSPATYFPD